MTSRLASFQMLMLLMLSATAAFAEPEWGRVQGGLQLGIEWRPASAEAEPAVQVWLRNAGAETRMIAVGLSGTDGPIYTVQITAVRDDTPTHYSVFDVNALRMPPSSLPATKQVRLEPGAAYLMTFPLKQLVCVVERRDIPVQDLLKQGYLLQASFNESAHELLTPELAVRDRAIQNR